MAAGRTTRLFQSLPVVAAARFSKGCASSAREPLPYSAIPGPRGLPLLGTSLDYMRHGNQFKMYNVVRQRIEKYGTLYRERVTPTVPEMVFVCDPKDVEIALRADGKWPSRPYPDVWADIRKKLESPLGMFLEERENWYRQRQPISQFMLVPRKIGEYHQDFNSITQDLLALLRQLRDPQTCIVKDVLEQLSMWSFESVAFLILGKRLGNLSPEGAREEYKKFIASAKDLPKVTQEIMFSPPFHKVFPTKAWKRLLEVQEEIIMFAMKCIKEREIELMRIQCEVLEEGSSSTKSGADEGEERKVKDFLGHMLLSNAEMSFEELAMNTGDLLGAGVDTTALTLLWCLYCLARNPEVQEKLRSEVIGVVGGEKMVTLAHINKMPYLRQCIKETLRLYPVGSNIARILNEDIVLSGYKIPAGKMVLIPEPVTGRLPEIFPDPELFQPSRWEKQPNGKEVVPYHMFASLPFGFGPRACVGRRVAELELHIAVAHLMRNFEIHYPAHDGIEFEQRLLIVPSRKVDLAFVDL